MSIFYTVVTYCENLFVTKLKKQLAYGFNFLCLAGLFNLNLLQDHGLLDI